MEPASELPRPALTTPAQLNFQYDSIDDVPGEVPDFAYNEIEDDDTAEAMLSADSPLMASLGQSNATSLSLVQLGQEPADDGSATNESNEFRVMIVCLGLLVVSVGILANLLFSLLVACKRRRRIRPPSASLLVMTSMCVVYLVFLVLYCFKISVYFTGDNVIKCNLERSLHL